MSFRFTVLETSLNRAEFQWKCFRLLIRVSILGIVFAVLFFLLGAAIVSGWIVTKSIAVLLAAILCGVGLVAFLTILICTSVGTPDRSWLAAAVERIDNRFLDRLNALLFLEKRRGERVADSFAFRIARQAQNVATQQLPPRAFSVAPSVTWLSLLAVFIAGLLVFNYLFAPWQHLVATEQGNSAQVKPPEQTLDLALPLTNSVEQNQSWGEVRITDPGTDLKVTKVDVVPLEIEASANESLQAVHWASAVNGAAETTHELPPPSESRYAVYRPTIYLDELNLSDWDVMTYYAQARANSNNVYASEVYFLEVRPFREDIMKMPGGEGGKPYQAISGISALINRQQHIIRQTHQFQQTPPDQEPLQTQDRAKLADAEHDLSDSVQHLYAKMASEMENQPIGDALDNLAKAQNSSEAAANGLRNNFMGEAQKDERSALASLVAARKSFQKAVSDNPGAFDEDQGSPEESSPVADSSRKLNQMAEFRNEAKVAHEFIQKALEQQKKLEQRSRNAPLSQYSELSEQERKLEKDLQNFQEQHPQTFKGSESESGNAQAALGKAADALQDRGSNVHPAAQEATHSLEQLVDSMQRQTTGQQLADAYKLKQMLEQQARLFDRRSQPESNISDSELRKTAEEAKQTLEQLKKTADQEPTRSAFGQSLRDELNGHKKADLDANLQKLQSAQDEQSKQAAAGDASRGLDRVDQAFVASQPKSLQMAREADPLKPGERDSFAQGMSELDSLLRQLADQRQLSRENQRKQAQQALADLKNGMRSQFGDDDRGNQLLTQFEEMLKAEGGLEPGDLKKLMDSLQHFSVETSEQIARQEEKPDVMNIDPSRLPPAYRGRIQKYFEKLSEN